jgi:hypothetical protein
MAFPVTATLIASLPGPVGFAQPLYPAQIVGTILLLGVVALLNWSKVTAPPVAVPEPRVTQPAIS